MNETEARAKVIALDFERRRIRELLGEDAVDKIIEVGEDAGHEISSPDGRTIEVKGTKRTNPNYGFVIDFYHRFIPMDDLSLMPRCKYHSARQ